LFQVQIDQGIIRSIVQKVVGENECTDIGVVGKTVGLFGKLVQ